MAFIYVPSQIENKLPRVRMIRKAYLPRNKRVLQTNTQMLLVND